MPYDSLDPQRLTDTVSRLVRRVDERFPGSGLAGLARQIENVASHAQERAAWIERPILSLRIATGALVALIVTGLVVALRLLRMPNGRIQLGEFVQWLESGINDMVLIGAAIFFLVTLEARIKRRRALGALHQVRVIAHIIDMHQLTKDPERAVGGDRETNIIPTRSEPLRALPLSGLLQRDALPLGKLAALTTALRQPGGPGGGQQGGGLTRASRATSGRRSWSSCIPWGPEPGAAKVGG